MFPFVRDVWQSLPSSRTKRTMNRRRRGPGVSLAGVFGGGTFADLHLIAIHGVTYMPACVPSRYEFIVYTERPPVHIRKLIVPAVNYSACTPATAAAVPHVRLAVHASFHGCVRVQFLHVRFAKERGRKGKKRKRGEKNVIRESWTKGRML